MLINIILTATTENKKARKHILLLPYFIMYNIMFLFVVCTTLFLFKLFFGVPASRLICSVQYNGGLLPDIILLTQCYYHRGTRLNAMKRVCL